MPRNIYEPLKLNQTNRYAGYQFHARIRMDGTEPSDAFRYVVLTVCEWILKRIPEGDRQAPELQLPPAEKYAEAGNDAFRPYHISIGYALDITPLMNDGIWAMRIKEPDAGTPEREAVPGRFFTTRVGVRLNEKGYTELGIRIDVTDPASEEKEIDFAFRPGFVRNLFEKPFIRVEQVRDLLYDKAVRVETEEDYRQLVYLLESEDNQMPLAVFTYGRKTEDAPDPGDASPDFLRKTQEFFGTPAREAEPELFHDPDAFCGKAFGYAVTFVLGVCFRGQVPETGRPQLYGRGYPAVRRPEVQGHRQRVRLHGGERPGPGEDLQGRRPGGAQVFKAQGAVFLRGGGVRGGSPEDGTARPGHGTGEFRYDGGKGKDRKADV